MVTIEYAFVIFVCYWVGGIIWTVSSMTNNVSAKVNTIEKLRHQEHICVQKIELKDLEKKFQTW